jgi:hypothetical protein
MTSREKFILNILSKDKRKINSDRLSLLRKIVESMPDEIFNIMKGSEIVGLSEGVRYYKLWNKEKKIFTHIFENETVLLKHKDYPLLMIYGPKIEYSRSGFIEN